MILRHFCSASIAAVTLGIVLAGVASANANAQPAGITSKVLLRTTLSGDDTKESVMVSTEFAPGRTTGRHTHPGDEYTFVLQGTLEPAPKAAKRGAHRQVMSSTIPEA